MGKIRDEINKIEKERKEFDHKCVMKQKKLQDKCKHDPKSVTLDIDPSGNGSLWQCSECGSYFKKFPGVKE